MATALSTPPTPLSPGPAAFFTPGTGTAPGSTIPGVLSSGSGVTQLTYLTYNPKYFMVLYIGNAQGRGTLNTSVIDINNAIILPLPEKLQDNHGVNYQESPLGVFLGGTISSVLQSDYYAALAAVGTGIASYSIGGPNSPLSGAAGLTGYTPNQFLTILLQGPQYKKHSFTWNLSPRNFKEADNLRQIINLLHNSAAPNIVTGLPLFKFPKVFQLAFMPNSKFLFKFKPAILKNISVDYSGSGPSFYRAGNGMTDGSDNAPTNILLRLDFWEISFWLTGNWTDSNDPIDVNNNTPAPNPVLGLLNNGPA